MSDTHAAEAAILGTILERCTGDLPQNIALLIQNAPESFDDSRYGKIACAVRALKQQAEPVSILSVERLVKFDGAFLLLAELPTKAIHVDAAEVEASRIWQKFCVRQAAKVLIEAHDALQGAPNHAKSIIGAVQGALIKLSADGVKSLDDLPPIVDAAEFVAKPVDPLSELVAGVLHKGSKLALGGASKSFKTWTLLDLAVSVAAGVPWLGRETARGRVLFLNFEIQEPPWQSRIKVVAKAKGVELSACQLSLWNLRGFAADFTKLIPKISAKAAKENYALIVLDPIYKLYGDTDENSAGDVAALLNSLESLAAESGAAIAFGAHFAKGNAAGKEALDRISGSGVFARDPDSLLIFTKHEEDEAFTVESILRNFAPVPPFVVRWNYPVMTPADDLDPAKLRTTGGRTTVYHPQDLLELLPDAGLTSGEWLATAEKKGMSRSTFYTLRKKLERDEKALDSKASGKWVKITPKINR